MGIVLESTGRSGKPQWAIPPATRWGYTLFGSKRQTQLNPDQTFEMTFAKDNAADQLASIPLLIVISTAIATTRIPELIRASQGFWFMVSDARTDFAMFCPLIFLIVMEPCRLSVDARWSLGRKDSASD